MHYRRILIFAVALVLASQGRGQAIISDGFSDGSLGTNSGGTGGGFTNRGQVAVTESGGFANFNVVPTGYVSTMVIQSNTSFNPFQATPTAAVFTFGTMLLDSTQRQWVGYRLASATNDHFFPGTGVQGLYVSVLQNNAGEDTAYSRKGNLVAVSNGGTATTLASWDWSNTSALSNLVVTLTTTGTNYTISFSGATGGTPTFTTGSASGALSGLGTVSSNFAVGAHNQYWNAAANGGLTIDSISVTAIPEPSTYAAVAGFAVLSGAWLRRRRRAA